MLCGNFNSILLDAPSEGKLIADGFVDVSGRVAETFDPATVEVRIDGVDLVASLGLVPPFVNVSDSVVVGADTLAISSFSYDPTVAGVAKRVELQVTGLSLGPHTVEIFGRRTADESAVEQIHSIEIVGGFVAGPSELLSSGLFRRAERPGVEGTLVNAGLGHPLAGAAVPLEDGGSVRPGLVFALEGTIEGGSP
jgi:hypothetical protein